MLYYIWKPPVDRAETAEQWVVVTPIGATYIVVINPLVGMLATNAHNGRYVGGHMESKIVKAVRLFERLAISEDDPEAGLSLTVEID